MKQLLRGMAFCHAKGVMHRDLKPQNILIQHPNGRKGGAVVKIADFGLARPTNLKVDEYSNCVVTLWYRSPDVLCGNCHYSVDIDVWSIGCIFAELGIGAPLLRGKSNTNQTQKTFAVLGHPFRRGYKRIVDLPYYADIDAKISIPPNHNGFPFTSLVPNFVGVPGAYELLKQFLRTL